MWRPYLQAMNWPNGIEARPLGKSDVEAWAVLAADVEKVDQDGVNLGVEELTEQLEAPGLDLARDTVALWADGRMVGFGMAGVSSAVVDVDRVRTEGAVHPEWRRQGLGTALVRWLIRRAQELHVDTHPEVPGVVAAGTISTNVGATTMFSGFGFEEVRYYIDMRRPLDQPVPEVPVADGFRVIPFELAYDDAVRQAHNEAFQDHWGSTPRDPETWANRTTGTRAFRGAQSYLAMDGETVAAYVLCYEYAASTAATGVRELYIGQVGTRRAYRGRGLARATLAKVLAEAAQAGYQRGGLGVDADNPTGALGLYEGLGFITHSKYINYSLPMPSDV
ncbi:GNAT family N-acetyltransferase [Kribbella solani]